MLIPAVEIFGIRVLGASHILSIFSLLLARDHQPPNRPGQSARLASITDSRTGTLRTSEYKRAYGVGYGTRVHKDRWSSDSADDCISAAMWCGVLAHQPLSIGIR